MKKYRGSFTVEASYILPIILMCFFVVIELSVSLHSEVNMQIKSQEEKEPLDVIKTMYRSDYIKDLLGEIYEN